MGHLPTLSVTFGPLVFDSSHFINPNTAKKTNTTKITFIITNNLLFIQRNELLSQNGLVINELNELLISLFSNHQSDDATDRIFEETAE